VHFRHGFKDDTGLSIFFQTSDQSFVTPFHADYTSMLIGFSISFLKAEMISAPLTPSIAR
jgi:hypothetical protein